jgi:hypothetical protein
MKFRVIFSVKILVIIAIYRFLSGVGDVKIILVLFLTYKLVFGYIKCLSYLICYDLRI